MSRVTALPHGADELTMPVNDRIFSRWPDLYHVRGIAASAGYHQLRLRSLCP